MKGLLPLCSLGALPGPKRPSSGCALILTAKGPVPVCGEKEQSLDFHCPGSNSNGGRLRR